MPISELQARIEALTKPMGEILAGNPPEIQSAALADLVAMWLAGNVVMGDLEATAEYREWLFGEFVKLVRGLVEENAKAFGTGGGMRRPN